MSIRNQISSQKFYFGFIRLLPAGLAMAALFLSGCLPPIPVSISEEQRAQLGRVAVVNATHPPRLTMKGLPLGRGEGANAEVGAAIRGCMMQNPLLCVLFAPIIVPIAAVIGAVKTDDIENVDPSKITGRLKSLAPASQEYLKKRLLDHTSKYTSYSPLAAPSPGPSKPLFQVKRRGDIKKINQAKQPYRAGAVDYSGLSTKSVDTVLEVSLLDVNSRYLRGTDNGIYFHILAVARLIRVRGNAVIQQKLFGAITPARRLSDWVLGDEANLNTALERGYDEIARGMADYYFLNDDLAPIWTGSRNPTAGRPASKVVKPISQLCFDGSRWGLCEDFEDHTLVSGNRPTLEWEKFPSPEQLKNENWVKRLSGARDIVYDVNVTELNLFQGEAVLANRRVFERSGLTEPRFTPEKPLEGCKVYRWAVRARYRVDGQFRATHYTSSKHPQNFSYPTFRTPCGVEDDEKALTAIVPPRPARSREGMVKIQGGSFRMGETGSNSSPPREMTLRPFHLDETEVTQSAFLQVMGYNPSERFKSKNPVEMVNWNEASRFCRRSGKRLPSEAEWEYALRAGTKTPFPGGDWLKSGFGNYCFDCDEDVPTNLGPSEHQAVKSYKPNPWGLHDMLGNVAEWVADWHGPKPPSTAKDLSGRPKEREKAVRGGSWESGPSKLAAHVRDKALPRDKNETIGFRCAADAQ